MPRPSWVAFQLLTSLESEPFPSRVQLPPAPGVGVSSRMDITKTSKIHWVFMR